MEGKNMTLIEKILKTIQSRTRKRMSRKKPQPGSLIPHLKLTVRQMIRTYRRIFLIRMMHSRPILNYPKRTDLCLMTLILPKIRTLCQT